MERLDMMLCPIPLEHIPVSHGGEAPRLDVGYAMTQYADVGERIASDEVLRVGCTEGVKGRLPDEFHYCEIGHIDNAGRISPYFVQRGGSKDGVEFDKQTDRIMKKIEKGDIVRHLCPAVLVPKTRPYLGKFAIVTGTEETYFTKALIPLVPAGRINAKCDQYSTGADFESLVPCCLLFLSLKGILRGWLSTLARWGKSYPVVDTADICEATIGEQDVAKAFSTVEVNRARRMAELLSIRESCDVEILRILQGVSVPQ